MDSGHWLSRAARWTCNNFDRYASVSEMVNNLGWRSLEQRHADARLCLFYKVVYGLVAVPLPDYVQLNLPICRPSDNCKPPGINTCIPFFHW